MFQKWFEYIDENPVYATLAAFVVILVSVAVLDLVLRPNPTDILVEAHGLLMDLALIGMLLAYFERRRDKRAIMREREAERRAQAQEYRNQLHDFRTWSSEEGVLRKVGILKRLLEMNEQLPSLAFMQLAGANLSGLKLADTNFLHANLSGATFENSDVRGAAFVFADLRGAHFTNAELEGAIFTAADVSDAKMHAANGLTASQLVDAKGAGTLKFYNSSMLDNLAQLIALRAMTEMPPAELQTISFRGTDLRGYDLSSIKHLSFESLLGACIDERTILPASLEQRREEILRESCNARRSPVT